MIKSNAHKYSVSALCNCLGVARATYYRLTGKGKKADRDAELKIQIEDAFTTNRCVYGSRKIKAVLKRKGVEASVRRINRNMKELGLVSVYHQKKYRASGKNTNTAAIPNLIAREFDGRKPYEAIVSDLTYVRVTDKWHYICILLDLYNREIVGFSAGPHKNAELVQTAFYRIRASLSGISVFHTDRGGEFDNALIDEILEAFGITRSLSLKGCPYDNAVAESTFKMIKAEFVYRMTFDSLDDLNRELEGYVYWFNNIRVHGKLNYLSPVEYRRKNL